MPSLSLRYRIALTALVLQAAVLGFVLWRVVSVSISGSRVGIETAEASTLGLLEDLARRALLTAEYKEFQPFIDGLRRDPRIAGVVLWDDRNTIVASTRPEDLTDPGHRVSNTPDSQWTHISIANAAGPLGRLSVQFSAAPLLAVQREAWIEGLRTGALCLVLIAIISASMGLVITRRLNQLVEGAKRVGAGQEEVKIGVRGSDEIGQLGAIFDDMARNVGEHVRALRATRDGLEQRVVERTEELREAKDKAESASQAKGIFLATMSHEVRTPLNGVIGMAELLLESSLSAEQRNYVTTIQSSAESLLAVLNDVLDFSKIEAGKLTIHDMDLALRKTVGESAALFAEAARRKNLELTINVDPALPDAVRGDPARLRQVLTNLLANAVKFTDHGFVRLSVKRQDDVRGRQIRFDVEDTGIGIAATARERLFERFSQAETSTAQYYGGSGLGLAICRQLVEMMGGTIQVESEPRKGSRFWFTVPLRISASPPLATAVAAAPTSLPLEWPGVRILVADDNQVNQTLVRHMLRALGCEVDVVSNGAEAITAAQANTYDLIFLDCRMPGVDGYAATREIRAAEQQRDAGHAPGRRVPIVALTADGMSGDRERCLAAGMDDHLTKPMRPPALKAVLRQWLGDPSNSVSPQSALPVLDIKPLLDNLEGSTEVTQQVLTLFVEQCEALGTQIRLASARNEEEQVIALAHKLAGSAAQIGALQVAELAHALEAQIHGNDPAAYAATVHQLQVALETARREIAQRLANMSVA